MTKKLTEKYNDASIKLFEFIKMLYEGDVEFHKVLEHFSDGNYDGTSNTHVTLNKYLNALKTGELHESVAFAENFAKYKARYAFPEES